jgi:hypothetical protein
VGKSQRITPGLLRGFGQQSAPGGDNRFPLTNAVTPVVDLDRYDPLERLSFGGATDATLVNEINWFGVQAGQVPLYVWDHQRYSTNGSTAGTAILWRLATQFPAAGTAVPVTSIVQPKMGTTCFQGSDLIGAFATTVGNRFGRDPLAAAGASFWCMENEVVVPVGQIFLCWVLGLTTFTNLPATGTICNFNLIASEITS